MHYQARPSTRYDFEDLVSFSLIIVAKILLHFKAMVRQEKSKRMATMVKEIESQHKN